MIYSVVRLRTNTDSHQNPSTKVLGYFHLVRFTDDSTPTFEAKPLGYPVGDGYGSDPGVRQDFEGGYTSWDSKTSVCEAHK